MFNFWGVIIIKGELGISIENDADGAICEIAAGRFGGCRLDHLHSDPTYAYKVISCVPETGSMTETPGKFFI